MFKNILVQKVFRGLQIAVFMNLTAQKKEEAYIHSIILMDVFIFVLVFACFLVLIL